MAANTQVKSLVPPNGLRGVYKLRAPFDEKILPNVAYACNSTRGVSELINSGIDPFNAYYKPEEISPEQYEFDVSVGMVIVSLMGEQGIWVDVPSTYIDSMPDLNGTPYTPLIAAVRLGAVEDAEDLTVVKQRIADVVLEELGIVGDVQIATVGLPTLLTQTEHESLVASRNDRKAASETDRAKWLEEKARADRLQQRVTALEKLLIAKDQA